MGFLFKSKKKRKQEMMDLYEAEHMAPQYLRIADDCTKLVNETKNAKVFFPRYNLLVDTLEKLISLEKHINFTGNTPSRALKQVHEKRNDLVSEFIYRFYEDTIDQIDKLKTDKAKKKRVDNFYSTLSFYFNEMSNENIKLVEELDTKLIEQLPQQASSENGLAVSPTPTVQDFDPSKWYIMISFGHSTSKSVEKAVYLAQSSPQYQKIENDNGDVTHTAKYSSSKKDFLDFIVLYDIVSSWKSTIFVINGEVVDKKTVGQIKRCYGDKCRTVHPDFCYGASYMTDNPFGCHRLQISRFNNPYWDYYKEKGLHYELDRAAMLEKIKLTRDTFRHCPDFDEDRIIKTAMSLPLIMRKKEYKSLVAEQRNVF